MRREAQPAHGSDLTLPRRPAAWWRGLAAPHDDLRRPDTICRGAPSPNPGTARGTSGGQSHDPRAPCGPPASCPEKRQRSSPGGCSCSRRTASTIPVRRGRGAPVARAAARALRIPRWRAAAARHCGPARQPDRGCSRSIGSARRLPSRARNRRC